MINATRIGGYIVREDSTAIHVQSPSGRVVSIEGDCNYRAFIVKSMRLLELGQVSLSTHLIPF